MSRIVPLLALAALSHAAPVPFLLKPERPSLYANWFDHWDEPDLDGSRGQIERTADSVTFSLAPSPFRRRGTPKMLLALKGDFTLECRLRMTVIGPGESRDFGAGFVVGQKAFVSVRIWPSKAWCRVSRRDGQLLIQTSKDGKVWSDPASSDYKCRADEQFGVFAEADPAIALRATFDRLKISRPAE